MALARQTDLIPLRDIVSDLFACLGPLRACEESVQQRIVEPVQELVCDPTIEYCVDPVRNALSVNPLACIPGCGYYPSLPQFDSPLEQDSRAAQLARARSNYQYNYTLVRTFRDGKQGPGIAVLDSVPMEQLPSLCWVVIALQNALVILDNLLLVMEMLLQEPRLDRAAVSGDMGAETIGGDGERHEATLLDVTSDYPRAELERDRDDVRLLRANLFGTLVWGRSVSDSLRRADDPPDVMDEVDRPLRTLAPAHDQSQSSTCPCPRCSPGAITRDAVDDIKNALGEIVRRIMLLPGLDKRPYSIAAYDDLFQRIALPNFALWFQNDEMFAQQRVAGQNPVVLRRIEWTEEWSERFPVTDEQYRLVMGVDDSLEEAGQDGRLYICDYRESLENGVPGDFPPFAGKKFINVPLALFALEKRDRGIIRAVAVQAGQEPESSANPDLKNPVITPDCGWSWEIAKTIVQNADCNDSEFYRHLGLGHLLTEAFILATYRQLPRQHPLYALLTPNFVGTLFTNNTAVTSINVEGSYLNITEMIFSCTVDSTLGIAGNAVADVNFNDNMLPNNLRARGVDDPALLPNYPYRDDAMLIWNAIRNWTADYVSLYYRNDADVLGDYELQGWVQEVTSPNGGRIRGVGDVEDGRIATVDYLIECLTAVIFTASAHHALTNFPLADYELYEPGWPGALYAPPPREARGATRMEWLRYLSKLNIAVLQQALGFLVGSTYFTRLGYYPMCSFTDIRVAGPLAEFQSELANVERIIRRRNETRMLPYTFLLPSRIPASTNI
jgi:arachidonate 15-lipoxygenase